jgi:hypothetical protein
VTKLNFRTVTPATNGITDGSILVGSVGGQAADTPQPIAVQAVRNFLLAQIDAGAAAAVASAVAAATSALAAAADAALCAGAIPAAEASGAIHFYDTKAAANAALAGLAEGDVIEVLVDESRGNRRTRYRVESGVFVFKIDMSSHPDWINVRDFGAVGDGVTDDGPAIQAAIDYAIYTAHKRVVYLPSANYKTTGTLHLGYGTSLTSVTLLGDGERYDHTQATQPGTAIICTATDRPVINIQGGLQTRVRGIKIVGAYSYIADNNLGIAFDDDDWNESTWKDGGFPAASFLPKSVHAGITIDAYAGAQPGTHYPDVVYPGFLGVVSQYNKTTSSDILLEDVNIANCVVAVAGHPCTSPGNGEFIRWRGGRATACLRGFAIGHSQSRLPAVENVDFGQCYIAIDNAFVGDQQGQMQGVFQGCHFGGCWQIINVTTGFSGSILLRDCYGERIGRLGDVAATGDGSAFILDGCNFDFRETVDEKYGVPQSHSAGIDARLQIVNGTKLGTRYGFIVEFAGNSPHLKLDGVLSVMSAVVGESLPAAYEHGCGGFLVTAAGFGFAHGVDCAMVHYRAGGQYWKVTRDTWNGAYAPHYAHAYTYRPNIHSGLRRIRFELNGVCGNAGGLTFTLASRSAKSVEISSMGNARQAHSPGGFGAIPLDEGDAIRIGNAWFVVDAVDADTVALIQLSNYRRAASGGAFIDKSNADSPGQSINTFLCSRVYAPDGLLAGEVTASSGDITDVKNMLTDGNSWSPDFVAADDYALIDEPEMINPGGGSVPRHCLLDSLNTGTKVLTFSPSAPGNVFPFSKGAVYLPFWIKTFTP